MSGKDAVGTGILRGGRLEWDDQRGFTDQLKLLKDGSVVVRVEPVAPKALRSIKANRYYYGVVLKAIHDETQQPIDDIHDFMCDRFLNRTVFLVNKSSGEVEEREVAGRSSTLPPDDFFAFVEQVRLFAAEFFGLRIPDPDPAWRLRDTEAA